MNLFRDRFARLRLAVRGLAHLTPIQKLDLATRWLTWPALLLLIVVLVMKSDAPAVVAPAPTATGTPTPTSSPCPSVTPTPLVAITQRLSATATEIATATLTAVGNAYFELLPWPWMRPASTWTLSDDGVQFVAFWEGYVGSTYDDGGQPGVGNCTIGYGHLLHLGPCSGGEAPASISQVSALALLKSDLANCGKYVDDYIHVPISQQQYNILTGLVCGVGKDRFATYQLVKEINAGDYVGAAEQLKVTGTWGIGIGYCPGLVRRRLVESRMFLYPPELPMWPFIEGSEP